MFEFKDYQDQIDFEKWAFGESGAPYSSTRMHSWNSLHGEKLFLNGAENVNESVKKMYAIYQEELKNKFTE